MLIDPIAPSTAPTAYSSALKRGVEFFCISFVVALVPVLLSIQNIATACQQVTGAPGGVAACGPFPWHNLLWAVVAALTGALIKTLLQLIENVHTAATSPTIAQVSSTDSRGKETSNTALIDPIATVKETPAP